MFLVARAVVFKHAFAMEGKIANSMTSTSAQSHAASKARPSREVSIEVLDDQVNGPKELPSHFHALNRGLHARKHFKIGSQTDISKGGDDTSATSGSSTDAKHRAKWEAMIRMVHAVGHRSVTGLLELAAKGIPTDLRRRVWIALLEVRERSKRYRPDYYRGLLRRLARVSGRGSANTPAWLKQIRTDLPRTTYAYTQREQSRLELTLGAHYIHRPEIGYCQGMNILAAGLLRILPEEDAFWALDAIVDARASYYSKSMAGIVVDQTVLDALVRFEDPKLYARLNRSYVGFVDFSTQCFMCLFAGVGLPFSHVLRLWDALFVAGDELTFALAISMLLRSRDALMNARSEEERMLLLRRVAAQSSADILLCDALPRLGRHGKRIAALRAFHKVQYVKDQAARMQGARALECAEIAAMSPARVLRAWRVWLSRDPWSVLLRSGETDVGGFADSLCSLLHQTHPFLGSGGVVSGFITRIMRTCAPDSAPMVSFTGLLRLQRILRVGTLVERTELCFRFFDEDGDGWVSHPEMLDGLRCIEIMLSQSRQVRRDSPNSPTVQTWQPRPAPARAVAAENGHHEEALKEADEENDPEWAAVAFTNRIFGRARRLMVAKAVAKASPRTLISKTIRTRPFGLSLRLGTSPFSLPAVDGAGSDETQVKATDIPKHRESKGSKTCTSRVRFDMAEDSKLRVTDFVQPSVSTPVSPPAGETGLLRLPKEESRQDDEETSPIAGTKSPVQDQRHGAKDKASEQEPDSKTGSAVLDAPPLEDKAMYVGRNFVVHSVEGVSMQAEIERGWQLHSVNGHAITGLTSHAVAALFRRADLPCKLVFSVQKNAPVCVKDRIPDVSRLMLSQRLFTSLILSHPAVVRVFFHHASSADE